MNQAPNQAGGMENTATDRPAGRKKAGSIAVVALLALYALIQPHLNERFGWNLPGLKNTNPTEIVADAGRVGNDLEKVGDAGRPADAPQEVATSATSIQASGQDNPNSDSKADPKQPAPSQNKSGPLSEPFKAAAERTNNNRDSAETDRTKPDSSPSGSLAHNKSPSAAGQQNTSDGEGLLYGLLRETRTDRYISPQGIQYLPGSAEGHRLEHLRRHTEDQPSRPGKHGVFDGGMEGALATIDDAYQRAKKNQRTTKEVDQDRTIYTVDLGRRVGYVGGRDGNRLRKPMARRVKMVLEGTQFITAYPL
ncbi:MAG: hypothetical protein KDB00_27680 [Planctomycetales bacterium]|nr:hypothetical protein [Planctomycetales bacterium]